MQQESLQANAELLVDVADGIMTITINRPAAKNAINENVAQAIANAMDELDSNPAIRVAILTGAEGTFCSGMDLKAFVAGEKPVIEGRGFAGICEVPPKKPIIAAIEGFALAGGCEIAGACDIAIAANNARFGIPETKRGLVAAGGGLMRLPRQIPRRIAMEMALTGDLYPAERVYELGFINRLTEPGQSLAVAREMAATIAANGPLAVAESKRIINESQDWSSDEMFAKQAAITDPIFVSADALEGARAFAEKRAPVWQGK
ncbi:crotonase/enoyl-CoA hydratase family protein [Pseudomaricurvus sp. HS19]|uniref:crotonase/enoyl-CoA hydratase family protein n=1 Tax=Pseudomaricurvus sp. HS19 TaxID=2692626 RepID=UPI00136F3B18|nr:crotonase/enoyl-CoA hydratase family protein [Pseudomaricurvus sp. HS19]MYM63449.1 crotonase/enoyl-CoA hydratase family protein [Pseudomaricurvus sp. HS19]